MLQDCGLWMMQERCIALNGMDSRMDWIRQNGMIKSIQPIIDLIHIQWIRFWSHAQRGIQSMVHCTLSML
jgi:hypothetical protein